MTRRFFLTLIIVLVGYSTDAQRNHLITENDFENVLVKAGWGQEVCCSYSIIRSDSLARSGRYATRFDVRKTDPIVNNGVRTELRYKTELTLNVERWYGFSVFLPTNYRPDPEPEIIAQWHETPDFDRGETWRSPPIALFSENGKWRLHVLWATDTVNTNKSVSGSKFIELDSCKTGVWTDWVFHIRFSWQGDGLISIYKNGQLFTTIDGPNAYNDKRGTYFKIGVYKWPWMPKNDKGRSKTAQRVLFYDEVRIGDEKASYADVAPEGNR